MKNNLIELVDSIVLPSYGEGHLDGCNWSEMYNSLKRACLRLAPSEQAEAVEEVFADVLAGIDLPSADSANVRLYATIVILNVWQEVRYGVSPVVTDNDPSKVALFAPAESNYHA